MNRLAASMFSGAGIGDKGIVAVGTKVIVANEISSERAALYTLNFPSTKLFVDDAWKIQDQFIKATESALTKDGQNELFLFVATPPCQGMSQNGAGTILNNVRKGQRPVLDPRNRLIIPALKVAARLQPRWVFFENVVEMQNTVIEDESGNIVKIVDLIPRYLGSRYVGNCYRLEFADYGLPQRRQRLITVYTRDEFANIAFKTGASLVPGPTHNANGRYGQKPWVTLRKALAGFAPLDSINSITARDKTNPLHRVPVLDPKKYEWIRHTPENGSAFDNQCVNPACGYQSNPVHGAQRGKDGINRAKKDTPLYCVKCHSLLPRPYTKQSDGGIRLMNGYTSAYKRMSWDLPAPTLTRNLSYPCSDHKVHPTENRVLSLAEACKLQSISDYDYQWGPITIRGKQKEIAPDTVITDCIGESIPPTFTEMLIRYFLAITERSVPIVSVPTQRSLFAHE